MKTVSAISIIKRLRQKNGISQKELAGKVGLTQQAIALIESGKRKLDFELFINILNELGVTSEELSCIISEIYRSESDSANAAEKILDELEQQKASGVSNIEDIYLLNDFEKLNNIGKKEARKRVQELTEIPRYTEPDQPHRNEQLNAAHKRTDIEIPDGVDTSENDIMDDEDF